MMVLRAGLGRCGRRQTRREVLQRRRRASLSFELLEERRLLAVAAAIPPGVSNSLDFLLSVMPDEIKDVIPEEISNFPGASFAYQAFPQEVNEVQIDGNALNFFLLLEEGGDNVPILRLGPAITEDLIEEIKVGLVDLVADVEFPVSQLFGFDLPGSSAIVPNPQAILQFFPFFDDIANGVNALLDFGIPDITIPEVRFPSLEIPDLGVVCPCEIIPEFQLIPEFTLFPGFTIADVLPDPLVDVVRGIASFIEDIGPGGVYINTLDGDDSIDGSHLSGIEQTLFAGEGNDTVMPGGGEQLIEALGLPGIPGLPQPPINVFGNGGRDTIVVNRRYNVDDFNVDGGPGNDILMIDASGGNDLIELRFSLQGMLEEIRFLAPNPSGGDASNATQRLSLPDDTTDGTFNLTFDDGGIPETTGEISYAAAAATIQTELEKLPAIGAGNVQVSGPASGPWVIEFVGSLAGEQQSRLVPDGANLVRSNGNLTVVRSEQGDPNRGTNEIQRITLPTEPDGSPFITGGTFTLTYDGPSGPETTAPIRHHASPAEVDQALEDLPSIEPGDVRVVGLSGGPWLVEFTGNLGLTSQTQLTADGSKLTGGVLPTIAQIDGEAREQTLALPNPKGGNTSLGGTFTLAYDDGTVSDTSTALFPNASAAAVQAALENLAPIGVGNVTVAGPAGGPYNVALTGRPGLAGQPLITANAANLTGGVELDVDETTTGSGVNEVQRISAPAASGGTFRLAFDNGTISRTTGDLLFDATVGEVQAALEALSSIGGPENVVVSGTDGGPWNVEFTGELAAQEQLALAVDGSGLVLAISPPAVSEVQSGGGGNNEVQGLSAPVATGGTFTVTFDDGATSETTAAIPFDAQVADLRTALLSLPNIPAGAVDVSGTDGGPWEIAFIDGGLDDRNLDPLTIDGSGLSGDPVVSEQVSHVAGSNEVQAVSLLPSAGGGAFTLTFEGETTPALPFNATAAEVETALQNLASLQGGSVVVTRVLDGPWNVEFAGRFAASNRPAITGEAADVAGGFDDSEITIAAVPGSPGVNEQQTITMPAAPNDANSGSFRLTLSAKTISSTTGPISYAAKSSEVEDALEALDQVEAGDVIVSGPDGGPWTVEFSGSLAATDLPLMSINPSQLSRDEALGVDKVREAGLTNELQTITLPALASGGTFTLAFDDGNPANDQPGTVEPTVPIPYDATPSEVQAALEALATIDPGDVQVRGGVGDPSVRETITGGPGQNTTQQVTLSPLALGGTFTLAFAGETTSALSLDAGSQAVEDALEALPSIGSGNVQVSGPDGGPFTVEFTGSLSNTDQPLMEADGANLTQLEHSPWQVEFLGQYAAQPRRPLVADGTLLEVTGANPRIAELTHGSDGSPLVLKTTKVSSLVSIEQLQVNGNGGDDTLIVRGTPDFPLGVIFDGGDGIDHLELISTAAAPSFVSPIFPDDTQGVLTMDHQQIQIADVEGGIRLDAGGKPGRVVFSGTDEGNELRFAGLTADLATMARDGQVTTTLTGFADGSSLTLRGEQGGDVISVAPGPFRRFENILISGGGPSGADAVLFEGTTANDVFTLTPDPTSSKAGTVGINGSTVTYEGMEEVGIQGLEGVDALSVREAVAGSKDYILFNPEVGNNGSFQFTSQSAGPATTVVYAPVVFQSIETRDFDTGTGVDTFSLSSDHLPGVNSSASVVGGSSGITTAAFGDQATTFTHDVDPNDPDILTFEIGTADDVVSVTPGQGIKIVINTALGDDRLQYNGMVADLVLDTVSSTISQPGLGDVQFTNAELVQLTGNGSNGLTVWGAAQENGYSYTPLSAEGGRFRSDQSDAAFAFTAIGGTFLLSGGGSTRDRVRVAGSSGPDRLFVDGPARTVQVTDAAGDVLKPVQLASTIESVSIDGDAGDDAIRVIPANQLFIHVDGNVPNASDRLLIEDSGSGNLVLHREGPDGRSGSVTVGALLPVDYLNLERVDIVPLNPTNGGTGADGLGRLVVFDADPFEHNESLPNRADFPALSEIPMNPNIDPGAAAGVFVNGPVIPADEDWYRFDAVNTGTLRFELVFEPISTLANGNPGLPGDGELQIEVYDPNNNLIPKGVGEAAATHTVGVEADQSYSLRVRGVTPEAINNYDIRVVSLDEIGPQVTDLFITDDAVTGIDESAYDLFDLKPTQGPTPQINSLTIKIRDLSERFPGFLYGALDTDIAAAVGQYRVVGDHNGIIPIWSVEVINDPVVVGENATGAIVLHFTEPLPDDRFTLTVSDNLVDPVGNRLDGESNASEPQEDPSLPSGDSVAEGDFVARFTVDSRAEIGAWASGSAYIDTNGNLLWDPESQFSDDTNEDIAYKLGFQTDNVFAGNFAADSASAADGFDKLAAYGQIAGVFRWLIDTNNNGVPDLVIADPAQINGRPVAGNFDGNAANGDEVGLKDGNRWYLDTDHDFAVDRMIEGNLIGLPVVGDFDGDGDDDLGAWADDLFALDLSADGIDGFRDTRFGFGFPGAREIPYAADFNGDGVDDLGLWDPDASGASSGEQGEWYVLMSQAESHTSLGSRPLSMEGAQTIASVAPRAQFFADDFVPVNPKYRYRLSAEGRSGNDSGGQYQSGNLQYFGFASYDSDQRLIEPFHVLKHGSATDTRLAVTLEPGDTTVILEDATGWANAQAPHQRALAWYGYSNSDGYTYPDYTYTRNVRYDYTHGIWDAGGITGNVITLHAPWNGPKIEAGVAVRNATAGAVFNYSVGGSVPNHWTHYGVELTGTGSASNQFRPGTAFIKPVVLTNYQGGTNNLIRWRKVDFGFAEIPVTPVTDRIAPAVDGTNGSTINFTPVPFGPDLFASFGDPSALPVVGNFDPPVVAGASTSVEPVSVVGLTATNPVNAYDVDGNGQVVALDALKIINYLNRFGAGEFAAGLQVEANGIQRGVGVMLDVNADGAISPFDALQVINQLHRYGAAGVPTGEGEQATAFPPLETVIDAYFEELERPIDKPAALRSTSRRTNVQRSEQVFAEWMDEASFLSEADQEDGEDELEWTLELLAEGL